MDEKRADSLNKSLITIASEFYRFQRVFEKAISKLEIEDQGKYLSQFSWFSKKVTKALEDAEIKLMNPEGQLYDPGMAVSPLNLDDFNKEEPLYVLQTIEPIIMQNDSIVKTGTVILGRIEE